MGLAMRALFCFNNKLLKSRKKLNEQKCGGELPGVFEVRRVADAELTGGVSFDSNFMISQGMLEFVTTTVTQVKHEGMQDGFPEAGMLPAVVMLVAGLPGGGGGGQVIPGLAGGELEEDVLEDKAVIEGGAAAGGGGSEEGLEQQPLGVGEEHGD